MRFVSMSQFKASSRKSLQWVQINWRHEGFSIGAHENPIATNRSSIGTNNNSIVINGRSIGINHSQIATKSTSATTNPNVFNRTLTSTVAIPDYSSPDFKLTSPPVTSSYSGLCIPCRYLSNQPTMCCRRSILCHGWPERESSCD